jgi:hypothetical protein
MPTVAQKTEQPRRTFHYNGNLPDLANTPDLISTIESDIAAIGLVGEQTNGMLCYQTFSSRVLRNPNALVARGASGAGKSTVLKQVARLFPPSVKIEVNISMTPASWFNTDDPDYFKHKVLISGERKHSQSDEAKDATAILRQLLSEKRINRTISVWDKEASKWRTVLVERDGPIAYAESTTSPSIFAEDLNRMLQIYTDSSEQMNRKVIQAIGSRYDPDREPVDEDRIIKRHHEFQLWLQEQQIPPIAIPYHAALSAKIPAQATAVRRIVQQIYSVIESITLLHQNRREQRNGYILANLDDYEVARRLLLAPIRAALGFKNETYEKASILRNATKGHPRFDSSMMTKALGFKDRMQVSRFIEDLLKAGLVIRTQKQSGRIPAKYAWLKKVDCMLLPMRKELV